MDVCQSSQSRNSSLALTSRSIWLGALQGASHSINNYSRVALGLQLVRSEESKANYSLGILCLPTSSLALALQNAYDPVSSQSIRSLPPSALALEELDFYYYDVKWCLEHLLFHGQRQNVWQSGSLGQVFSICGHRPLEFLVKNTHFSWKIPLKFSGF